MYGKVSRIETVLRRLSWMSIFIALLSIGCTGQIPGSFRLKQVEELLDSQLDVNTKIDLLWVVDNSASMDVSQDKLRRGFEAFATKYMIPTWDIRVAVITTDTYIANTVWNQYRSSIMPGTIGWISPYILTRLGTWVNPSWNPNLVNLVTGRFDGGVRYNEVIPLWSTHFSRLLPGLHDGPITGLCFEGLPYFMDGQSQCKTRDAALANRGVDHCLTPTGGETAITQCVNTVQNDTVRSGKAIIETMPPAGQDPNQAWRDTLIKNFRINITTGSAGHGSERGFSSVLQMLSDNEGTTTAFFRANTVRGIIFVSDEDDQSLDPNRTSPNANPMSYYKCDQASLVTLNPGKNITGVNGYCCTTAGCTYGGEGISCTEKHVDDYAYTVSLCPRTDMLIPVSTVKSQLDDFFLRLDGAQSTTANYFVSVITPLTEQSIRDLQTARTNEDNQVPNAMKTVAVDRGDRYISLVSAVGNGSSTADIGANDYSAFLDALGRKIVEKKSVFTLKRAPTGTEDLSVYIKNISGGIYEIPKSKISINDKTLTLTDIDLVLSLTSTDKLLVSYQPKTVY